MRTSRAGLAELPLEVMRPRSQALTARDRVLKKRAAQSHLSMRTDCADWGGRAESMGVFPSPMILAFAGEVGSEALDGELRATGEADERAEAVGGGEANHVEAGD